jgi:hypothetical protein
MNHKLNVELFLFDVSTDYLPHYRKVTCKIDEKKSVKDLLKMIQEEHISFEYPKHKTLVQINSKLVDARLKIKEIVNVFGKDISIDPASVFRATKDLRFNDSDFMQKYELLAPYCDEEDLKYYRTLYKTYYGSETLKYTQEYFGDSFFLLAQRLVENNNEHSDAILELVADKDRGMGLYEFENNSYPSIDITSAITYLKSQIQERRFINSEQMSEIKKIIEKVQDILTLKSNLSQENATSVNVLSDEFHTKSSSQTELEFICDEITLEALKKKVKHTFDDFNIAFYLGEHADEITCKNAQALLECVGANYTPFSSDTKACGANIVNTAGDIAFKKAGMILTDAIDSNADILIVDSEGALEMLNENISECERAVGREIPLQVITPAQLAAVSIGITDKNDIGISKSGSKITFI